MLKRTTVILLAAMLLAVLMSLMPLCAEPATGKTAEALPASGVYNLADFGPLTTPAQVKAAYEAAITALSKSGGLLVVPTAAAKQLSLDNTSQIAPRTPAAPAETKMWQHEGPGVSILEVKEDKLILKVPQIGGLEIDRTLRMPAGESLPHWSTDFALTLNNKIIQGSNSYLDWLALPVKAGKDARFYVKTIRGLKPGMFLNLHGGPGYGGGVTRGCVKTLGFDAEKKLWYFTADTSIDHVAGAILHNKNNEGLIYLGQDCNADEQTYDVMLKRHKYALGDTYMFFGWYEYMSNIHSAAGDENGNIFAGYSKSIANAFAGTVESVDWKTQQLKFAPGAANVETLGQSRDLVNMNTQKWITKGKVLIVPAESYWDTIDTGKYPFQGKTYPTTIEKDLQTGVTGLHMGGLIHGDRDCPWDRSLVGRLFGLTDATELEPSAQKIRWYEILDVLANADGTKDLVIQRFWWGAKAAGSPTLYRLENCSWDGHLRPLSYAIAPGTYVNNVAQAVPTQGYAGERIVGLAPYADADTPFDFAKGDKIEQAIGPDPFKPNPFRMWTWDNVPGVFPSPMLDLANFGADPRYAAMAVRGGPANSDNLKDTVRQLPPWENSIIVESAAGVGLNLNADFTNAAILFQQPYHDQLLKWRYGPRTPGKPIAEATLGVSRDTGDLTFTGGDVHFNGSLQSAGLSADGTPARNLRGKNLPVAAGATFLAVTFPNAENDGNYAVMVEQSWLTNRAVTKKTTAGFTVLFDKPAPADATLDWVLVR